MGILSGFAVGVQAGLVGSKAGPLHPSLAVVFVEVDESDLGEGADDGVDLLDTDVGAAREDGAADDRGIGVEHAVAVEVWDEPGGHQASGIIWELV